MVVLTIAGKEVNFGNLPKAFPEAPLISVPDVVSSGKSTRDILRNQFRIIQENAVNPVKLSGNVELLNRNTVALGQSQIDISNSLSGLATQTGDITSGLSASINEINQRLSQQVTDLGNAVKDASAAAAAKPFADTGAEIQAFLTGNVLGVPNVVLIGGLLLGVLVLK